MARIRQTVDKAGAELVDFFEKFHSMIWKEEDIQAFLFHRILTIEPDLKGRLHREYPIIRESDHRDWAGMLDLAITEETNKLFPIDQVKIDCAIELKFQRRWETGLSPNNLNSFTRECERDAAKLRTDAKNFKKETIKIFWAFRLTRISQEKEVQGILEKIKWDNVTRDYFEIVIDSS